MSLFPQIQPSLHVPHSRKAYHVPETWNLSLATVIKSTQAKVPPVVPAGGANDSRGGFGGSLWALSCWDDFLPGGL